MQKDDIPEIVEAILKPLKFASKDGFARVDSVKGLEKLICGMLDGRDGSAELRGDEALSRGFEDIKRLFSGFDSLRTDEKKERIRSALGLLDSFTLHHAEKDSSAAAPAPPAALSPTPTVAVEEARLRLKALSTPLEYCKGIGPKLAGRLRKKGLTTVEDMLYFLPIRYEDRRRIKKIRELTPGLNEVTTGEVLAFGEVYYGRRRVFEAVIGDGSALLKLKWFNYRLPYMKRYKTGQRLIVFGTVSQFARQKEIIHPDIEFLDEEDEKNGSTLSKGIVPIYSQIENFHQKTVRKIVKGVVDAYSGQMLGVPKEVLLRHGLIEPAGAVKAAHCPDAGASGEFNPEVARKSLVFDELFLLELTLSLRRNSIKKEKGISFFSASPEARTGHVGMEDKLRELLPFKLTSAQERTLLEIKKDMAVPHPMNRLVQGDVGSGKTIVSFIAALWAMEAGYQCAVMAPTEILAEQHYLTTRGYAERLGIGSALLKGSMAKKARREMLCAIKSGEAGLVIGTHALLQDDVEFKSLGLVIIDEQHRFGVIQRAALKKKGVKDGGNGIAPDMLIMTATPIPRTLSMTVFGDLDVSIIDEMPPGRQPVHTRILREKDRRLAYETIIKELNEGSQAYIVYPLVEESEELSLKDATNMKEHLQRDVFRKFNVGLLHGRMKSPEKEAVMRDFKDKLIDVLVSTTVIEVGVDVPNATVILIEHAERFGLAQLHQLRGRVGRGVKKSICLLLAAWTRSEDTYKRLKVMEETMDGFRIAEEDLKIRGPGDFLGVRQSGLPDFRTSGALTDMNILKKAREEAFRFAAANPGLLGSEPSYMKEILKARWAGRFELVEVG